MDSRRRNSLIIAVEETFEECLKILVKKNGDYGADNDPYRNFRFAEQLGIGVEKAIMVRMADKLARVSTLLDKKASVSDESLEDTLNDLINYSAILIAYRKENKNVKSKK